MRWPSLGIAAGLLGCGPSTPSKPTERHVITVAAGDTWAASDSCKVDWDPKETKRRIARFEVDRDLVTCGEWKSCVAAGACDELKTYECVTNTKIVGQRGALEFCKWQGGRLPTWAEWSLAARGDGKELRKNDAKPCVDVPTNHTRGYKTLCFYVGPSGMTFALFDEGGGEWTSETDCPQGPEIGDRSEVAVGINDDGSPNRTGGIRAAFRCAR